MSYLNDMKKMETKLNGLFGVVTVDDLSDYEKEIYITHDKSLNDFDLDEYENFLYQQRNENANYVGNPYNYSLKLIEENDEDAVKYSNEVKNLEGQKDALTEQINKFKPAYDNEYDKYNKLTKKYEDLNKEYQKKIDELNNKVSENGANLLNEQNERVAKYKELMAISLTKKNMLRADLDFLSANDPQVKKINNKIKEYEEDIKTLEAKIGDMSVYDKAMKSLEESFKKEKEALNNKYMNKIASAKTDMESSKASVDKVELAITDLNNKMSNIEDSIKVKKNEFENYCIANAQSKLEKTNKDIDAFYDYKLIKKALANNEANRSMENITEGLSYVKAAYDEYKTKYSAFKRFFRPFIKEVRDDYQAFKNVRAKYLSLSGAREKDVNKFLDGKGVHGTLRSNVLEHYNYNIHEFVSFDKNYNLKPGFKVEKYLADFEKEANKVYNTKGKAFTEGSSHYAVDKGLLILNTLSNLKHNNPSKASMIDESVNKIVPLIKRTALYGRSDSIDEEIANALLPEAERKVIEKSFAYSVKDKYEEYKKQQEINEQYEENTVVKKPLEVVKKSILIEDEVKVNNKNNDFVNDDLEVSHNLEVEELK